VSGCQLLSVSEKNAYEHVRYIADQIGPRIFGTAPEKKTAKYVLSKFEEYGVNARIETFGVTGFVPKGTKLEIVKPMQREINCVPLMYSDVTPPDGIVGQLACVNVETDAKLRHKDIANKIVLVRAPPDHLLTYRETADKVAKHGAAGIIFFSREGSATSFSLNPNETSRVPSISISSEDGQNLLMHLAAEREVIVKLQVTATKDKVESCNVIGGIKGTTLPQQKIVLSAHQDSVINSPGANDDASGVAAVLELARIMAEKKPKRTIAFIVFGAEEPYPYYFGSWSYVQKHKDELTNIISVLNFDMIGVGAKIDNRPCLKTTAVCQGKNLKTAGWLENYILQKGKELGYEFHPLEALGYSDQVPFLFNNVPAVQFRWMDDPWYHSSDDKSINVDPKKISTMALVAGTTAWKLANAPKLPG
jgi:aminopeptidase YwaD